MELAGKTYLVTGGSGFVGSHLVDALTSSDAAEVVVFEKVVRPENLEQALATGRVRVIEGDVTESGQLEQAMRGVDGVFHLAVLPLGPCTENPRRCLEVNVVGTFNLLEAAQRAGVGKIVFSSASSVYGDTLETMDESHPLDARTMYGASKIAGEYFCRAFYDMYELEYVTLRYMNVYGPRQDGGLIASVLQRIASGKPPVILGDGGQSFDFVHVADVSAANVRAMASDLCREEFNVGSGMEVTVKEIVERLLELTGSELEPEFRRDAKVPMTRRVGSNERALRLLGWRPERDLDAGLRDLIEATVT